MREATARKLLQRLLALYPPGFREAMGEDLVDTALYRWRDAQRRMFGELRFWSTEGVRFAADGVLERAASFPARFADLGHGWRQVTRAPAQHLLALATLALGIAATTTIFTVADAVVFRPLPYRDADRLYLVHSKFGTLELSSNSLSNIRDLQSTIRSMSWLAGAQDRSPALYEGFGDPQRVSVLDVSEQYLPRLGGEVQHGRGFAQSDFAAGAPRVAIVSAALWQERWARDRAVIGRSIRLDGVDHTIVGVMRRAFRDPEPIESGAVTAAWVPARVGDPAFRHRDDYGFRTVARLADGATIEQAAQELSTIGKRLAEAYPDANVLRDEPLDFVLYPLKEFTVGSAGKRILLLLGAVVLLLLLSCANAASLYLARGINRTTDLAVRSALGASRGRLAAQLFAENLVTAFLAAIAGTLLAIAAVRVLIAAAPAGIPRIHEVAIDVRVLGFVILLTLLTAILFGTVPALRAARAGIAAASGLRSTDSKHAHRLQSGLVALQIALSLVLVSASLLLLNSFRNLLQVEPGFDAADVIVADVRPPHVADSHARELAFYQTLLARATADPRVQNAALMHTTPGIAGGAWSRAAGEEQLSAQSADRARAPAYGNSPDEDMFRLNPVYGDAFGALDTRLLAGQGLAHNPGKGDALVVVLNQTAARRLFGTQNPIGRRIALGGPGANAPLRTVIGVVADVRQSGPAAEPDAQVYQPYAQRDINRLSLVLERKPGTRIEAADIRAFVREVAAEVPVDRVENLGTRYAATSALARFLALLLTLFGAIGLLLAVVGTYATATHLLSRRTRELGIRVALGARKSTVFRVVISRAVVISAIGIAAGLLSTLGLARFLEAYVYAIQPRDPLTLLAAALLIAVATTLASLGPALRATRVDPNRVLRGD